MCFIYSHSTTSFSKSMSQEHPTDHTNDKVTQNIQSQSVSVQLLILILVLIFEVLKTSLYNFIYCWKINKISLLCS